MADGEAEQAETKASHLRKQLSEHQRMLGSKEKGASKLQAELAKEQQRVDTCTRQSVFHHKTSNIQWSFTEGERLIVSA